MIRKLKSAFVVVILMEVALLAQSAGDEIQILPVQGNIYMLVGSGGNTTVQIGDDGFVVVDSQSESIAPAVMEAIRTLTDRPIRNVVITHFHPDHTLGSRRLIDLGAGRVPAIPSIMAHENVLLRIAQMDSPPPTAVWPENTYFGVQRDFYMNGEAVVLYHMPAAHTDGDSIVFFRKSDVISTGDVFTPDRYPVIDVDNGGSVQGFIDALNYILRLTVPAHMQEGGTRVIPGHGRLSEEIEVVEYRNMLTIVRERIQALIDDGLSLEEVRGARPTRDYDVEYHGDREDWTTDMFVEAVYRSLSGE
jgi:cyclase